MKTTRVTIGPASEQARQRRGARSQRQRPEEEQPGRQHLADPEQDGDDRPDQPYGHSVQRRGDYRPSAAARPASESSRSGRPG